MPVRVVQGVRGWHYCCEARITCNACTADLKRLNNEGVADDDPRREGVHGTFVCCEEKALDRLARHHRDIFLSQQYIIINRETRVTPELYDLITENLINAERMAGQLKKWRKHEYCKRLAASLHHAVRCGVGDEGSESQGTGQLLGNRG